MTDRIRGLYVTLAPDMRDDDADRIVGAIGLIKGVIDVTPNVEDIVDHDARQKVRHEIAEDLDALGKKLRG